MSNTGASIRIALLATGLVFLPLAGHAGGISEDKVTKTGLYLSAAEAGNLLGDASVLLVDIRSHAEIAFLGLPERVDVHIPYMELPPEPEYDPRAKTYKLELNPDFPLAFERVIAERALSRNAVIVLMCRSGTRSAKAANLLADMGYANVYSLVDGFEGDKLRDGPDKGKRLANGWKNAGLAWSYSISDSQLYPADRP